MSRANTHLDLVQQKLAAFEQLQPEFEQCFQFVQQAQGQACFAAFPVNEAVRYLHSLWICDCKDRLLSIYHNMGHYEGITCLKLLQQWQEGTTSEVIAFLQRKLDGVPFASVTGRIEQLRRLQPAKQQLLDRLTHGLHLSLNRMNNLTRALEAIFALSEPALLQEVQEACRQYGHQPEQIKQQIEERNEPLYSIVPDQRLAQQNMLVMNRVGLIVMTSLEDLGGKRSERVVIPAEPALAEHIIANYHAGLQA